MQDTADVWPRLVKYSGPERDTADIRSIRDGYDLPDGG
jgi:hypothetical protein